jgi:hypothetical protein
VEGVTYLLREVSAKLHFTYFIREYMYSLTVRSIFCDVISITSGRRLLMSSLSSACTINGATNQYSKVSSILKQNFLIIVAIPQSHDPRAKTCECSESP